MSLRNSSETAKIAIKMLIEISIGALFLNELFTKIEFHGAIPFDWPFRIEQFDKEPLAILLAYAFALAIAVPLCFAIGRHGGLPDD